MYSGRLAARAVQGGGGVESGKARLRPTGSGKVEKPVTCRYIAGPAHMRIAARLAGASLMVLTGVAGAQSPDPEKTPVPVKGMDVSLIYDGELVSDVSGGEHRGSIFHGSLQAQAAFDLGELFGWRETTASLYGMLLHGARPESLSGAAQGVSSISGKSGLHLDEAWIQRNFDHDRFSFLAG